MTALKLDGFAAAAKTAVEAHVRGFYDTPGARLIAVVELEHTERTQPGPTADKEPSVKGRVSAMEVAAGEKEPLIRQVMRALYLQRTATGTFDEEEMQSKLSDRTVSTIVGQLHAEAMAEMRVAMQHVADRLHAGRTNSKATEGTMRADMEAAERTLLGVLAGRQGALDELDAE